MKFYCDACNTKYAISDDKVRGKVLKVRCKNCGNVVTVRENRAPVTTSSKPAPPATPPAMPAAPAAVPTTNWYYALNGETFGPFTLEVLRQKYAAAEISDASYVWHETFTEWKPAATVSVFAEALAKGHKIRPRMNTLGFTGDALEAIRDAAPSHARSGAVPEPAARPAAAARSEAAVARSAAPEPRVSRSEPVRQQTAAPRREPAHTPAPASAQRPERKPASTPELPPSVKRRPSLPSSSAAAAPAKNAPASTPEARPLQDLRRDKLERLRERLTSDSGSPLSAIGGPEPATSLAAASDSVENKLDSLPKPVDSEPVFTFAPTVRPREPEARPAPAADAIDFDFPVPVTGAGNQPSPSSTSDILDTVLSPVQGQAPEHDDEPADSGVIPFVSDAPKLQSKSGSLTAPQASESILVELSSLQKQGRGKRVALVASIGVALLSVIALGAYQLATRAPEPTVVPPKQATAAPQQRDELVIRRYSRDEQEKIGMLELEEELLFDEDEAAPTEDDDPAPRKEPGSQRAAAKTIAAAPPAEKTVASPNTAPSIASASPRSQEPVALKREPVGRPQTAKASTGAALSAQTEAAAAPEEPKSEADLVSSLLKPRASVAINRPKDSLREQAEGNLGLSKDEARKGFKRVKDSVRICRERHNRHNAQLDAQKIKVGIKVQTTGKVSDFTVEPRSVQNTEFDRCMQSHKERWRFASFQGDAVVINTSIVLQ